MDAIALRYGYTGTALDGTAQTKAQFVQDRLRQWIRDEVRSHEQNTAAAAATKTVTDVAV